ncbi:hypothetical protein D3C84_1302390 [compost metagenome]
MDRSVHVLFNELLAKQDRILVVVAFPSHESNDHVAAQRQFALLRRWTIGKNVAFADDVAFVD